MKLIEALSTVLTEPVCLEEDYCMRIMVEGKVENYKPVDFRMKYIRFPLRKGDVDFIYEKEVSDQEVYKSDVVTKMYYPPSTRFVFMDGTEFEVLSYGPVKEYKNMLHVTVHCKSTDESKYLIEPINNMETMKKVLDEMNKILLSNEELKALLPEYSYNWMLYSETRVNDRSLAEAHKILDEISWNEDRDFRTRQSYIMGVLEEDYIDYTTSFKNYMYDFSRDFTQVLYGIEYNNVTKHFRMKAIVNWLLSIAYPMRDNIDYDSINLVNKLYENMNVKITSSENQVAGSDIVFDLTMPSESNYNYRISTTGVVESEEYGKYTIETISLHRINKLTGEEIELKPDDEQNSNYDTLIKYFEILSAYYATGLIDEYYENIPKLVSEIKPVLPYFD